jgi:transposase
MKNSTAKKLKQVPAGYLIIGVDPHKKKHVAVAMTQDAVVHTKFKFTNSWPGYEEALQRARAEMARTGCPGVIWALEAASHYWRNLAYFLEEQGFSFYLINQFTLKRRREGQDLNRRKNDFRDAEMAAELLRTGEFTETRLPQGLYAELRASYKAYRRLVWERSRAINLLRGLLDGLFPEFSQVFKDPCGQTALRVLLLGPVPQLIIKMRVEEFVEAVKAGQKQRLMRKKLQALHLVAQSSIGIEAGAESVAFEVSLLAQRLKLLSKQIKKTEERLVSLLSGIEDSKYLLSIVGLSYISVAGLLAELGPLKAYQNAKQLIKMAGTNPIQSESAGKRAAHTPMSKKGRPGLRCCGWMAVIPLLRHNADFRAWAKKRRERPAQAHPLKGREVLGAAVNRLLRLAYALVKKQTLYQMPQLASVAN